MTELTEDLMFEVPQGVLRELRDLRQEVERLRAKNARMCRLEAVLHELDAAEARIAELEQDRDAGREFMRRAWHELNAIRARDGAPIGVNEEYFSEVVDGLQILLASDAVPWTCQAAQVLTAPLNATITHLEDRIAELEHACASTNGEVCQTLGKALGYPWYKDDQKNFPGATEADGICEGEHVAESIAAEAAKRIAELKAALKEAGQSTAGTTSSVRPGGREDAGRG